jgi:hypothetical protein
LAALPEVKSAYVKLTNHKANVAITHDTDGTHGHGMHSSGWNGRAYSHNGSGTTGGGTGLTGTNGSGMPGASGSMSDQEVSNQVKDKVADIVKGMSPATGNVYVSSNADFYGRMKGYADEVNSGHPIQGLVNEFNALVNRIFPTEAGTNDGARTYSKTAPSYHAPTTPSHGTMRDMTR